MYKDAIKKDGFQVLMQNQLGSGLVAVGLAISLLLDEKTDLLQSKNKLIKYLGDTGQILSDLHHEISITRRAFIIPRLSLIAKKVAETSKFDELLFGKDFSEKHKEALAMD